MQKDWDQRELERRILCSDDSGGKHDIRRVQSVESFTSGMFMQNDFFKFEDFKISLDDVDHDGPRETRQPVQHPSGNAVQHPSGNDRSSTEADTCLKASNVETTETSLNNSHPYLNPLRDDQSFLNPIYVSNVTNSSLNSHIDHSKLAGHPNYGPYNGHSNVSHPTIPNNHQVPHTQKCFSLSNGNMASHSMFYPAPHYYQQSLDLRQGYHARPITNGLEKSLTNISPPAPVHVPQYDRNNSKTSVENESTNSYFSTIHPTDNESYNENGPSPTPNANTAAATTRPYVTPTVPAKPYPYPMKEKVTVFVTYAEEPQNELHINTIVQIAQTLLKNCIDVTVDVLEETVQATSISNWLEDNIANNDFILICVSPSYRQVVESPGASITGFPQNESTVNTQYIYRRLHTEYIKQGSKNFRFLPVLLSGANAQHVPAWLRDTKIFEWPKGYEDIIYRLYRQEKFIKPKTGRPPTHTVEMYNSFSNQKKTDGANKDVQPTHSKR